MTSHVPTLSGVAGLLGAARTRIVKVSVMRAALVGAAAGLAVFIALELIRRLLPHAWLAAFGERGLGTTAGLGVAALIVVAGLGTALALYRAPPIDALARRADAHFGLRERIATALEVGDRGDDRRPAVVAALMADVERHGSAIDPAQLAARPLPAAALAVPLLAVVAALVVTFVPVSTVPARAAIEARLSETLAGEERAAAAEDIRRVADLIAAEADKRDDTYMQAVANTLEDLGQRLEAAPETTRGEVLEELGTLMEYATAASSEWRGSDGERIPRLLEALSESIAMPPTTPRPMPEPAGQQTADAGPAAPAGESEAGPSPQTAGNLESMLDEMEQRNAQARAGAPGGEQPEVLDYIQAAKAQAAARRAAAANQDLQNAQLLGPAADARAGESILAGEGTDAIAPEAVTLEAVDFETSSELVLTGDDSGEGRRLELEVAPDANFTEITAESLAANESAWQRHEEAEAQRFSIDLDKREAVSRYLRALVGPAEQ